MKRALLLATALAALAGCHRSSAPSAPGALSVELAAPDARVAASARALDLQLDGDSARRLADFSRAHVGQEVALSIDGHPIARPRLREEIRDGRLSVTFR